MEVRVKMNAIGRHMERVGTAGIVGSLYICLSFFKFIMQTRPLLVSYFKLRTRIDG